jgi:hypothetical protein
MIGFCISFMALNYSLTVYGVHIGGFRLPLHPFLAILINKINYTSWACPIFCASEAKPIAQKMGRAIRSTPQRRVGSVASHFVQLAALCGVLAAIPHAAPQPVL